MPYAVSLVKRYVHPKTRKRLTAAAAQKYNRRAKKKIKPYLYLQVRHTLGTLKGLTDEQAVRRKRNAGKIAYRSRLTQVESIVPLSSLSARHVRLTLGRRGVFKKLFDDFHVPGSLNRRGSIRITLAGFVDNKRVRQITHLAFSRIHWLESFGSEEHAYEEFKNWIVGNILANLRRRDLRLSNPKESLKRISWLKKSREMSTQLLDVEDDPVKRAGLEEQIKWQGRAIRKQKKSKQMTQAFLRLEKLI